MSAGEFYQIFSGFGRSLRDQQDREDQKSQLSKLGEQLQGGDYSGAAGTAFKAGDLQTGINLLKLGQGQAQSAQANAAFGGLGGLYGGGGGFGVGGPVGASGGGSAPAGGVPSFLDQAGPQGDYLAGLFKRESNNNPNAQASTSGARGLGQFIPSTWNATARQHPELGLTPVGPGSDGRTDPQQMIAATKALTADNEGILAKSGLPVNDATRYALHFLGAGGGPRLIAGTLRNPDAPAMNYADPKAVAANRNVFFNRDGTPKSAGQVMQDFGRSFGGGGQSAPAPVAPVRTASADPDFMPSAPSPLNRPLAPVQGLNPGRPQGQGAPAQRPVQFADDEAQTQALEGRMGMYPRDVYGIVPQAGAPAQAPRPMASADPQADMPVPNAQPAEFRIPPAPQGSAAGSIASLPAGPSTPQPRGPLQPAPQRAVPLSSDPGSPPALNAGPQAVPTLPSPGQGAAPSRVMALPGQDGDGPSPQARAQVSAQAPQHLEQAGLPPAIAQAGAVGAPGSQQRIGVLMRIAGLPGLSEAQSGVVKSLLANELEQTKLPELQKNYMLARSQGFGGTLLDYQNELRKPLTPTVVAPGNAAIAPGERAPFYVNPRAPTAVSAGTTLFDTTTNQPVFTAPAREGAYEGAKLRAQMDARREAAPGLGLVEGTPSYRSFVGAGKIGADRDMSAGDKKTIDTADNAVLSAQASIGMLEQAKELSAKAYAGPLASERGKAMSLIPGNEAGQATLELDNLVTTNALTNLKSIFGGNPTEGERKILLDVAGSSNLPHALRVKIYQRAIDAAQLRQQQNEAKAAQIREGTYYRPGSGPGAAQGAAGGGQSGAPALPAPSPSNRPGAVAPAARFQQLMGAGMTKDQAYQQLHSEGY
ncbi:transglycosylase SLT domain-containing protein [Methylobacterium sp. J-072]|uniref:transglycosylase SLT domain-containing protein n=1 Tax=Methylobacterium sp. J-072 TaxID=2836651 RepID=UPI001FBA35DD|nr:transglycosylase SLT domain-containing protein [Methylobacterium sp. J-072]MCJ2093129.1 transglycosylase SLT domain-containing protein [Methylobacterium sp. J-072]